MTMFASKAVFVQLGLEQVAPSTAHMYQDCSICNDPLDVNIHTAATDAHHRAVRISICGHMHGQECLSAWLDTGNSCPTCKRMLFEASGRSATQSDINSVMRVLQRLVGTTRAVAAITRLLQRQDLARTELLRANEEGAQNVKAREAQSLEDDVMGDDEWMDSGDEDLDMDDEESFDVEDEDEGGGVAVAEDVAGSKSAAV